ncbi:MAG TPA: PAS domain-containing protein, partial [Gemmata sp.]
MTPDHPWGRAPVPDPTGPGSERALLSRIIAVQQEVATADPEPGALMDLIVARTHALTQADGAVVELAEGDEMVYRAATGTAATSLGVRLKLHSSLSGLSVLTGEVLRCDDAETDDRVDRAACRRVGVRSMVVVPLRTGGTVVGVLKVMSVRPAAFGEHTVHTLQLMTGLLAAALANARAFAAERALGAERERALRASEGRFVTFMNNSPVVAFAKDASGRYTYANEPFRRLFCPERDEVIGASAADLWPEPVASRLHELDGAVLARGAPVESEEVIPTAGGADRHWLVYRFPFADGDRGAALGGLALDVTDRRQATRARDETLALLDALLNGAPLGVAFLDADLRYVRVNATLAAMHGHPVEGHAGRTPVDMDSPFAAVLGPAARRVLAFGEVVRDVEVTGTVGRGSKVRHLIATLYPVPAPDGRRGVGKVVSDVTEQRALERLLHQAQRMEAVGQLAGGVAHDFNNLLTVINGCGDLLLDNLAAGGANRELVQEIRRAGDRAAALTRQLLAFSRRQVLEPKVLNLNAVVADAERLLRRLIGEDILLTATPAPDLRAVRVDPGQFEQVLLNLAVNARDAMPTGGRLTIETANADVEQEYASVPEARPGRYVLVAVSDTGGGIPPETLPHIFEPFFTTKGPGQGTGLGLATVHGIVRQSGGFVAVYSELGRGTTFKVYLPAVASAAPHEAPCAPAPLGRGDETVLVTEDDAAVRGVIRLALRSHGYEVLEAGSGEEAVRVAAAHAGPIHLLVTDVVMPGMGGRELATRLTAARPGLSVLYLSGYTDDAVVRHGVLEARVHFLQKPFTPTKL